MKTLSALNHPGCAVKVRLTNCCALIGAFFGLEYFQAVAGPKDLSIPPVLTPEEQQDTFQFAEPGYRIELVASDPMVEDPVAIQFDGEGRLWVVEMRGYMQNIDRTGVEDPVGRITVLEDTDNDGAMDKRTVFADKLVLPRSIAVHPDGILIAENKPLTFFEDKDGDLVADKKTLVDADYARNHIEHSANGLLRAMDNWIYNAKEGHRYRRMGDQWVRERTEARGQWGICQDDRGRLFYNFNHSQLHTDLVPPNALTRNPNHEPATGLSVGVTSTNEVFPIRPNLATNRGYIPGALDENGSIKQFTSACSPFIYRESLFPELAGNALVCETAGNLIKRILIAEGDLTISGKPAYPDRDFIASTDERFRPCWLTTGPDGAIYIADMYRGIVQDGPHMSIYLREHSIARKMDQPIHLGRIWRIVPDNFKQPTPTSFQSMDEVELLEELANSSGWRRDQAQMHLVERNLRGAIPGLQKMALGHPKANARLHALWTLEGLGDSDPAVLTKCVGDESPFIQAAAIRILQQVRMPSQPLARIISDKIKASPTEEVALQMILTLGDLEIKEDDMFALIGQLLIPRANNPLMRDATLSSLAMSELNFLESLWPKLPETAEANSGISFLIESLTRAVVKSGHSNSISDILNLIETPSPDWRQEAIITGIEILGSELTASPIELKTAPAAAEFHAALSNYFSWPGHIPTPPQESHVRPLKKREQALFTRGRQIFLTSCVACHGADGKGIKHLAPPLAGSDWVQGNEERLARVLFHGLAGPITVSGKRYTTPEIQPVMPPLATLGNGDIAAVLTYIRREWGNTADPISSGTINKLRIASQGRTVPWTEEDLAPFSKQNP